MQFLVTEYVYYTKKQGPWGGKSPGFISTIFYIQEQGDSNTYLELWRP